jgi:Txe/YoeB family toxin of Txe-Axe toxin-antitoxin module
VARSGLRARAQKLLDLLARDPFEMPPPVEKQRVVKVLRLWTHYE